MQVYAMQVVAVQLLCATCSHCMQCTCMQCSCMQCVCMQHGVIIVSCAGSVPVLGYTKNTQLSRAPAMPYHECICYHAHMKPPTGALWRSPQNGSTPRSPALAPPSVFLAGSVPLLLQTAAVTPLLRTLWLTTAHLRHSNLFREGSG
jgi:hypothetical protein